MSGFAPHANDLARQVNIAGDNHGSIVVNSARIGLPMAATNGLPRDARMVIGRDEELRRIFDAAGPGRAASIYTIDGMAGVGKTALVTHLAHLLVDRFPDGQFFVTLHAHTPGQTPAQPAEVLADLLTDSGADPRNLPDSIDARRALWRHRTIGKQVLLILDDAQDHNQIEPLLPAGDGCMTLITSRSRLIALDGAVSLALDTLEADKAAELFCTLARRAPTAAEAAAVAETVRLCGYLPLAIVLLAGRLAHRPSWTIAKLAADFAATQDRLGELEAGHRAVRAAFAMSYQHLPPDRKRLFRRLGLHPGPNIDAFAAAALADIPMGAARRQLDNLYTDHLIEEITPGYYRMHDLLRAYARTLAAADPVEERTDAIDRLLHYYQHTAHTADQYLVRIRRTEPSEIVPAEAPQITTSAQALVWMYAERSNLLACIDYAVAHHQPLRVIGLTSAMTGFLRSQGPWPEAVALHEQAAALAAEIGDHIAHADALDTVANLRQLTGDYAAAADLHRRVLAIYDRAGHRLGRANALHGLAQVLDRIGELSVAGDMHQEALTIFQEVGHRFGESFALLGVGLARYRTGDYAAAAELHQRSLTIFRELDHGLGQANVLQGLGWVMDRTGDYAAAADLQQQALTIYRDIGHPLGQANALVDLGRAQHQAGDYAAAADLQQQALTIYRDIGHRLGQANALDNLGRARHHTGDHAAAAELFQQAVAAFRERSNRLGESESLNHWGELLADTGKPLEAVAAHEQALRLAREMNSPLEQAHALAGIARCREQQGDYTAAVTDLRDAVTIYQRIRAAESATAATHLAELQQFTKLDASTPPRNLAEE